MHDKDNLSDQETKCLEAIRRVSPHLSPAEQLAFVKELIEFQADLHEMLNHSN